MAQLSGKAAAIKNQRRRLVGRQFALELVKLGVGDADRRGNVSLIEFRAFGSRIHDNHLVGFVLVGNVLNGNGRIAARGFLPCGKAVGKNLDIGVTKFFRLPGGFVTQLSGGPTTIKYEQGLFFSRQFVGHLVKLAVRKADRGWNVPLGIFGFVRSGIDDHDAFGLRQFGVLLDKGHFHDIMKLPIGRLPGFGGIRSQGRAGASNTEHQSQAQY